MESCEVQIRIGWNRIRLIQATRCQMKAICQSASLSRALPGRKETTFTDQGPRFDSPALLQTEQVFARMNNRYMARRVPSRGKTAHLCNQAPGGCCVRPRHQFVGRYWIDSPCAQWFSKLA